MGLCCASRTCECHFGCFTCGTDGVSCRPQMKVGCACCRHFRSEFGVGDLRNSVSFCALSEVSTHVYVEGNSLEELHAKVDTDIPAVNIALEKARDLLEGSMQSPAAGIRTVAERLGLCEHAVAGALQGTSKLGTEHLPDADADDGCKSPRMKLGIEVAAGMGAEIEVALGYVNTEGYRMFGARAEFDAGLPIGADLFCGKHVEEPLIRIVVGVSPVTLEYTMAFEDNAAATPDSKDKEDAKLLSRRSRRQLLRERIRRRVARFHCA